MDRYIYFQMLDSDGDPVGSPVLVNNPDDFRQGDPRVAMADDGRFVVVWADYDNNTDDFDVRFRRYDRYGNERDISPRFAASTYGSEMKPDVAMDRITGDFVIVWQHGATDDNDDRGIFCRAYWEDGTQKSNSTKANTTPSVEGRPSGYPTVGVDSGGDFMVAWEQKISGGNRDVFAQLFNSDGSKRGSEFLVGQTNYFESMPRVAGGNGHFVVAYVGWELDMYTFEEIPIGFLDLYTDTGVHVDEAGFFTGGSPDEDTLEEWFRPGSVDMNNNGEVVASFVLKGQRVYGQRFRVVLEPDKIGVHRQVGNASYFFEDYNGNGYWDGGDQCHVFGNGGDTPMTGDWNGDDRDEIGVHRGCQFYLDANGNGKWDGIAGGDVVHSFGTYDDTPITGDWDDDGTDEIGVHRGYQFYLDANGNGKWDGIAGGDLIRSFGTYGDTPMTGDWNGDGTDDIGVYRSCRFYLDANGTGKWDGGDVVHTFGTYGDTPMTGDWNGDGRDEIGVHRGYQFYLDASGNGKWNGTAGGDLVYSFGTYGDTPLAGNWVLPPPLAPSYAPTSPLQTTDLAEDASTAAALLPTQLDAITDQSVPPPTSAKINARYLDLLHGTTPSIAPLSESHPSAVKDRLAAVDRDLALDDWLMERRPGTHQHRAAVGVVYSAPENKGARFSRAVNQHEIPGPAAELPIRELDSLFNDADWLEEMSLSSLFTEEDGK
jgi:hypothetical protein